jgi:hypothetical protein
MLKPVGQTFNLLIDSFTELLQSETWEYDHVPWSAREAVSKFEKKHGSIFHVAPALQRPS